MLSRSTSDGVIIWLLDGSTANIGGSHLIFIVIQETERFLLGGIRDSDRSGWLIFLIFNSGMFGGALS